MSVQALQPLPQRSRPSIIGKPLTRIVRPARFWLSTLVMSIVITILLPTQSAEVRASFLLDFGGLASFQSRWIEQDQLVGTSGITRPYTWGPNVPASPISLTEVYSESPGYQRRVLYLDKARMELNQPSNGNVTTGLLVKELVSGLRQDGDNTFVRLSPSQTQVAGDPIAVNPDTPTYASFSRLVTLGPPDLNSKPSAVGQPITKLLYKNGQLSSITPDVTLNIGAYQAQTGHNIAQPFVEFMHLKGSLTDPTTGNTLIDHFIFTDDPTSNVFGLAISEPYWVKTKVAGIERLILVQLFERRVLTYNPSLNDGNRVELGNLGQHYYQWRYLENSYLSQLPDYPDSSFANPTNLGDAGLNVLAQKGFNTSDTMEQVMAFYDSKLPSMGWERDGARSIARLHVVYHNQVGLFLQVSYGAGCNANIILLVQTKLNIYFDC